MKGNSFRSKGRQADRREGLTMGDVAANIAGNREEN